MASTHVIYPRKLPSNEHEFQVWKIFVLAFVLGACGSLPQQLFLVHPKIATRWFSPLLLSLASAQAALFLNVVSSVMAT